ncbi:MAG: L-aspartate oxidase [Cyclobacteriaceae bacterium]|nr:L-aspartate oxidase [Cyclobacteriaceae bacterium]
MTDTDFLIIGSGIAGLSYAIKVAEDAPHHNILVVTKNDLNESNTKYAQGGIAVVTDYDKDSAQQHIKDTIIAGDGICDKEVVEIVVNEGLERLRELINWGAQFDKNNDGGFSLENEGGHSKHRVVHHKDMTGREIMRALRATAIKMTNIKILSFHTAIDLITINNNNSSSCHGVVVLDNLKREIKHIKAKQTILASGGAGQAYPFTTNPDIATGDGIAMAKRAGAKIEDMEFIQFHPTALYYPDKKPVFLISEAVRGFGAILRNKDGEAFMHRYDERKELASRDIVARAIHSELNKNDTNHVYLDCTHLDNEKFRHHFPSIHTKCIEIGINTAHDMIPVAPAAHYVCGGIKVNQDGLSSIANLYAIGECSRTGLHGANRLASNSLLEAVVFAHRTYLHTTRTMKDTIAQNHSFNLTHYKIETINDTLTQSLQRQLQEVMIHSVGIVRSTTGLTNAQEEINKLEQKFNALISSEVTSTELITLRNLFTIAQLIIQHSLNRKINKGGYYNVDLL